MKIVDILKSRMSFSLEVFPPKTDKGMENLKSALKHFYSFKPDFISCTYGAGGTNAGRTSGSVQDHQSRWQDGSHATLHVHREHAGADHGRASKNTSRWG